MSAAVRAALAADVPVLLWGPPGVGKTAQIEALAAAEGAHLETLIGSTVDPIDVGGWATPDADGVVQISPPVWARRIAASLAQGQPAWLFLDELSCAPPSVQSALLRVVQAREVAGLSIRGCRIIAASNPADTAADGGALSAATANRWAHLDWEIDVGGWVAGTIAGWGRRRPPAEAAVAASIAGFISRNPTALLAVPSDAAQAGRAWPSPRSWEQAIRLVAAGGDRRLAGACVGSGAAREWIAWVVANDLPDPEDLLAGRVAPPVRGDLASAAAMAMVAAAVAQHPQRRQRVDAADRVLCGMPPDVALAPARALLAAVDAENIIPDVVDRVGALLRGTRDQIRWGR